MILLTGYLVQLKRQWVVKIIIMVDLKCITAFHTLRNVAMSSTLNFPKESSKTYQYLVTFIVHVTASLQDCRNSKTLNFVTLCIKRYN